VKNGVMDLKVADRRRRMGFSYLKGKRWENVTRDERFFCALLYFQIKKDPLCFIKFLNQSQLKMELDLNVEWEVGFEVCFYRDIIKLTKPMIWGENHYSLKRTFDLCLFSEKSIIILEAKAQQNVKEIDITEFNKDTKYVSDLLLKLGNNVKVNLGVIASSKWINKDKNSNNLANKIDALIAWADLAGLYNDQSLIRADEIFDD
jgi:hypothetical protein